ncbi:MAG: hypothetical protein ACLT8E_04235 [Akkermansia sp.]
MILVAEGAHDTSAYQSNRNLSLSPRAGSKLHSRPGNPGGQGAVLARFRHLFHLSEEEYYLLSRGIPEHTARRMIAQGFLKHALDQFSDETLRAAVEEIVLS